jgi:hypothetical protein
LESPEEDWFGSFHVLHGTVFVNTFSAAEGNPDEEKIGAFGVGKYTVFLSFLG